MAVVTVLTTSEVEEHPRVGVGVAGVDDVGWSSWRKGRPVFSPCSRFSVVVFVVFFVVMVVVIVVLPLLLPLLLLQALKK
jgi:hypothetical protein